MVIQNVASTAEPKTVTTFPSQTGPAPAGQGRESEEGVWSSRGWGVEVTVTGLTEHRRQTLNGRMAGRRREAPETSEDTGDQKGSQNTLAGTETCG